MKQYAPRYWHKFGLLFVVQKFPSGQIVRTTADQWTLTFIAAAKSTSYILSVGTDSEASRQTIKLVQQNWMAP